jgi:Mg2+ and Co2+ transporter CorA
MIQEGMTVTWKEYVDTLDGARKDAVAAALLTVNSALIKADTDRERQLTGLGEKIDALTTRAGGSVPRSEIEALLISVGQRAETQIADAVTSMTREFSSGIAQLAKAVEAQGKTLANLTDSVNALNTLQVGQQGGKERLTATGRTVTVVAGILVAIMTLVGGLYAVFHH